MSSNQGIGGRGAKRECHLFGTARLVIVVTGLFAALLPRACKAQAVSRRSLS
jgi:hypothetical protein